MFRASRREVLRVAAGFASLGLGAWLLQRVYLPRRVTRDDRLVLTALLDVVVNDGPVPGHRVTGVLDPLIAELSASRQSRRGLVEGVAHLESEARKRGVSTFAALAVSARAEIFAACGRSDEGSVPRYFYRVVRDGAMRLHYSHPAARSALGLAAAPQPTGHLDYQEPPIASHA